MNKRRSPRRRRPAASLKTFKAAPRRIPEGVHELFCHSQSSDGRGIAAVNGKTVFVSGALANETVTARYTQVRKDFDVARMVTVEQASEFRVEPACQYFSRCGGCTLQHLDYAQQTKLKQGQLQHQLQQLSPAQTPQLVNVIQAAPYHYRHRVRLSVVANKQQCQVGFKRSGSHQLVAVDSCELVSPALNQLIPRIANITSNLAVRSAVQSVELIEDSQGKLAALLVSKKRLGDADRQLLRQFAGEYLSILHINEPTVAGNNVSEPKCGTDTGNRGAHAVSEMSQLHPSAQQVQLQYTLLDEAITLNFLPGDFTQVNPAVNEQMVATALAWLNPGRDDRVLDLFCGIGNFSLPLALRAGEVIGIELSDQMVNKAQLNAQLNGIENLHFTARDLMNPELQMTERADKVLIDPPRAGAENVVKQLSVWGVSEIVYISCNPATFFRDAQILLEQGYRLEKLGLLDMFPQTAHSELISYFCKPTQ